MKKHLLEEFVRRYDVGMLDRVVWICKDDKTEIAHKTQTANAAIRVTGKFSLGFSGRLCIPDTGLLKKILSILSDDITVELVTREDGTPHRLTLTDDSTTVGISLGSEDAFPKPTAVKANTAAAIGIAKLSPLDIGKFAKTVAVWKEETFAISPALGKLAISLGQAKLLKNTVFFTLSDSTVSEEFPSMRFSTEAMSKILTTHKQNESGLLNVYANKVCEVKFFDDTFDSTYTFFETKK